MALDGEILSRARARLEQRRGKNEAERRRRTEEVERFLPEAASINRQLRLLMSEVIRASVSGEPDAKEKISYLNERGGTLYEKRAKLFAAHGFPADYLEPICTCSRCSDKGYTENGEMCSCLRALYEEERTKEMSSLLKTGDDSFDGFDLGYYSDVRDERMNVSPRECMEIVFNTCREYALNFGHDSPNLLFRGGTGLGKTRLSACIANVVSRRGFSVVYDTASGVFDAFETQKFSHDEQARDGATVKINRCLNCDLMILDDLGSEMTTAFTQSALYNIVNSRLNSGRKMIISTNLGPSELAARYMPQTVSRIEGEFDAQIFMGSDIRAIKRQNRYGGKP